MRDPVSIAPLAATDDFDDFACGDPMLDRWIRDRAWSYERGRYARTAVASAASRPIGFVTLAAGSVERRGGPERLGAGFSHESVPVVVLARLAVDRRFQGLGIGARLLGSALRRAAQASEHVGVRAVVVHAKDDVAAAFYEHHDLVRFPIHARHLYVLMKDLQRRLDG